MQYDSYNLLQSSHHHAGIVESLASIWHQIICNHRVDLQLSFLTRYSTVIIPLANCDVFLHYNDVIMGAIASQITSLTIVYSTVYLGADQRKHQSSASLAFVRGIHRWSVNSPHKWPVTWKMFPFDDVIMQRDNPVGTLWWVSDIIVITLNDNTHVGFQTSISAHWNQKKMAAILETTFRMAFSSTKNFIGLKFHRNLFLRVRWKSALVQIMAWCRTGDKPLPEPMLSKIHDDMRRHWASMS